MKQVTPNLAIKLIKVGYPNLNLFNINNRPTIDLVLEWLKSRYNLYVEVQAIKDKYCYRYYNQDKSGRSQVKGCRYRNAYQSMENAFEAGIDKILKEGEKE